ncbi:MAG TPA: membrane protein insertase YidC, partial [Caulobacter sp.]|nr:membrane protein insertase YidC [Caulobacter sp.]
TVRVSREAAKAASPRVAIATPSLTGSLRLQGARIDDLFLTARNANGLKYGETLKKDSPPVELLRPEGAEHAWFADFGWTDEIAPGVPTPKVPGLPTPDTVWTVTSANTVLSPGKPVTLTYVAPNRLVFTRTVAVDDKFMFTVTDTVSNLGAAPVTIRPYASVQRQGLPPASKAQNVHEGAVGALGDLPDKADAQLKLLKFRNWKKEAGKDADRARAAAARAGRVYDPNSEVIVDSYSSDGGWLGLTDKYWLAALVPAQSERITGQYGLVSTQGVDIYAAHFGGTPRIVNPGRQITTTTRLFAGAKEVQTLKGYQKAFNIPRFEDAVDWGVLSFLTKPFFLALEFFYSHLGNFGLAILAMTVCVRLLVFPLAQKSSESMARMKKLQEPMNEIKARHKDDPVKAQQETMALMQREKVNPMAGCLPILVQFPVFLAFYKVLSVTIEMRHAPFVGWLHDLSAQDPTTILNLFGLLPYDPAQLPVIGGLLAQYLHIGVLPLLYGFTMWLVTAMNPPAPDPMQQRIFQLMPIMFTFIMAGFPAGLLVYWTFSNVFSIFQQYVIMHRLKTENPIDTFLARLRGEDKATA